MARPTPTIEHAEGMLAGIKSTHTCGEACTASVRRGDGSTVQLACPYTRLDVLDEADRRIVQSIYAIEARAAMGAVR
jgi:hypothetical protein